MLDVQARRGGCVLGLMEVPRESISLYGCAVAEDTDEEDVVRVTGLVEKPSVEEAPSNLAIIGRYVLTPEIFDALAETKPGERRRDPDHRRDRRPCRRRARRSGARRRVPRPSLRHR